jgi:hypothetical protein
VKYTSLKIKYAVCEPDEEWIGVEAIIELGWPHEVSAGVKGVRHKNKLRIGAHGFVRIALHPPESLTNTDFNNRNA